MLAFSTLLLCANSAREERSCGSCKSCLLIRARTHPDLLIVTPEPGKTIRVDQVRGLIEFTTLKPHSGDTKCVIVDPAESMNLNAANSLLKTLEEPPENTYLFLACSQPSMVPGTVRSRCLLVDMRASVSTPLAGLKQDIGKQAQVFALPSLAQKASSTMRELSDYSQRWGAILEDLEGVILGQKDPVAIASKWCTLEGSQLFLWLAEWFQIMLRTKLSGMLPSWVAPDLSERVIRMATFRPEVNLFDAYRKAVGAYKLVSGGTNVSAQSLLEELLIPISQFGGRPNEYR